MATTAKQTRLDDTLFHLRVDLRVMVQHLDRLLTRPGLTPYQVQYLTASRNLLAERDRSDVTTAFRAGQVQYDLSQTEHHLRVWKMA